MNCIVVCSGTADDYKKFEEDIDILNKFHWNSITPLKGGTSVKSNVERRVVNNDIIHFACHGLFAMDEDPLDSGLLLTPEEGPVQRFSQVFNSTPENRLKYFLTAREIFKFKSLNCNLVTLTCSSGRSKVRRGDELIGLTRAFLYGRGPFTVGQLMECKYQFVKNFFHLNFIDYCSIDQNSYINGKRYNWLKFL